MDTFLGSLVQSCCGEEGRCKQITLGCVRSVLATLGFSHSWCVCFPCQHCLGSRLLCRELSEAGPGLYALPRSKPLRFRYSGTPQRCRLIWACVLCPSQVQEAQVTRCFGERGCCDLLPPPSLLLSFLGVQLAHLLRWALTIQNPKKFWLVTKSSCSLVDEASLGPRLPPSGSGCPRLPVTEGRRGWAGLQLASSALFCERA